jgi:hypothetical protein
MEDELVVVASVWDPFEAEMILGRLRSAGIEAISLGESLHKVYGLTVDGLARQDIQVRPEDAEEARRLLAE